MSSCSRILSLLLAVLSTFLYASAQAGSSAALPGEWSSDLDALTTQLPQLHKNAFHAISKAEFEAETASLKRDLPSLNRDQFVVRVLQIVASIHDGHTSVPITALGKQGMHVLPIRLYIYPDGIHVDAADRSYEPTLGGRLISIGKVPADEILNKVSTLVAADNDQTTKERVTQYIVVPELLHGLGLINSIDLVPVTVQVAQKEITLNIRPVPMPQFDEPGFPPFASLTSDWIDIGEKAGAVPPLWLRHRDRAYWMEYLPERQALYVQYNRCTTTADEPISAFGQRMLRTIDEKPVEKLILDLRLNAGGEGFFNNSILVPLIQARKINQKGKLYVLIGRRTFSAAQVLANELEHFTPATFAGEPTGSAPHFYGDHKGFMLPNSHLPIMVAPTWWQSANPRDERQWIAPRIAADLTEIDYAENRDPVLDAIFSFQTLSETVRDRWTSQDKSDLQKIGADYKNLPVNRYADLESEWNAVGYDYLRLRDFNRAIAVFQMNTEEHPQSPNALDSLGDAYAAAGTIDKAIEAYQAALRINPHFAPSLQSLAKLKR